MTDPSGKEIQSELAELKKRYTGRIAEYLEKLSAARSEIKTSENTSSSDHLNDMRILVHTLAGSAPTFGFGEIGETAARLERVIDRALANVLPAAEIVGELDELQSVMHLALQVSD